MWTAAGTSARPVRRLGGAAPGGLILPAASPTPGTMYAPRGVWTDGERVVACDTGNHRVLIWHTFPQQDGAPADVVLGQPDFLSEGPNVAGTDTVRGMNLPTGVAVIDGRLVVADAWNHRILAWDDVPMTNFAAPTYVLGQSGPDDVEPNRGGEPTLGSFYWPFGFGVGRRHLLGRGHRQPSRAGLARRRRFLIRPGPPTSCSGRTTRATDPTTAAATSAAPPSAGRTP